MFCKQCGKPIDDGQELCEDCQAKAGIGNNQDVNSNNFQGNNEQPNNMNQNYNNQNYNNGNYNPIITKTIIQIIIMVKITMQTHKQNLKLLLVC